MRDATIRGRRAARSGAAATTAAAGLLLLAACGSSGYGSPAASTPSGSGATVTVHDAGGMKVLATSSGQTLYSSDQENGKVLCTSGACHAIWVPLTVSGGQKPTASGGLAADLSTLKEADGSRQVTFDGRPLYTFSFDHGAGQVNGDGQSDSFDGTDFTWHAATPTGDTTPAPHSSSEYSTGSAHGNGYGY